MTELEKTPLVYRRDDHGIVFIWRGGSNVGIFWADSLKLASASGKLARPFMEFGVYAHATGKIEISTQAEFEARCDEWVDALDERDLVKYVEEYP